MNCLSWNCRGLGQPRAILALKELIRKYRPDVIFLIETRAHAQKIEEVRIQIGFHGCFVVDRIGLGGGLAVLWKDTDMLDVVSYSINHIDMRVHRIPGEQWRLTGFYGCPENTRRRESWNLIHALSCRSNEPWVIIGDFNDMLSVNDKMGGRDHPLSLIEGFQNCVERSHLIDIPLSGGQFTWEKSRGTSHAVFEKLDRALANIQWLRMFPNHNLLNLVASVSDHNPILLKIHANRYLRKTRRFRFENAWLFEEGINMIVHNNWTGNESNSIISKIKRCSEGLEEWSKSLNMQFKEQKSQIYEKLHVAQMQSVSDPAVIEEKKKLVSVLQQEEAFYKQRAKSFWLKYGDLNTKYFHAQASSRKRSNAIPLLQTDSGAMFTDEDSKANIIRDYFSHLFSDSEEVDFAAFASMPPLVTEDDNRILLAPFAADEFKAAIDQMHPDKSPGPDGMNAAFFQRFCPLVSDDVVANCQHWLRSGQLPPSLNDTFLVLIGKVDKPILMKDFRPIALCNVLYKILSKVLANRLKLILPRIISPAQSAFVPGRSISDNIIVAFELIHCMRRKIRGKYGDVALKLDISKAYDRVDWKFLEFILIKMGFDKQWITWIMMCVSSVRYTVLLNGREVGPIYPKRGIRQGDPLSPYLFILCAEGLSFLIRKAELEGHIHGVRVVRRAPAVSHLFFADDSFFFFRANSTDCSAIKKILVEYEKASGQAVNFQKSGIFFSSNVPLEAANEFKTILGVSTPLDHGRYLGLPSLIGKKKRQIFSFLRERLRMKINNWKFRFLSRAGKEILLKTVAQALPNYCMNVFLLPISTCDELQKMMNSFWWGSKPNGGRKIHWLSWDRMCSPKHSGGLGFRLLRLFNHAMLAKQGWNLINNPSSLPAQVLKARYYPRSGFLESGEGYNPSFIWRSVLQARYLLEHGTRWRIGNGASVSVWNDPWIPRNDDFYVQTPMLEGTDYLQVKDLILESENKWDLQLINGLFCEDDVEKIMSIPLSPNNYSDRLIWHYTKNGIYSVKSGYKIEVQTLGTSIIEETDGLWKQLWHTIVPPKIKEFLWRACRGLLLTSDVLCHRGMILPNECGSCHNPESVDHVLLYCPKAIGCWSLFGYSPGHLALREFLKFIFQNPKESAAQACAILWHIWRARNLFIWQNKNLLPRMIVHNAMADYYEWRQAQVRSNTPILIPNNGIRMTSWVRPPNGVIKCNFDCAIDSNAGKSCFGAVARGSTGLVQGCMSGYVDASYSPLLSEALAFREALYWIRSKGYSSVMFESDCLQLVQAFHSCDANITEMGLVLCDCKEILAGFSDFSFGWVPRTVNMVAHFLAKRALSFPGTIMWDVIPDFVSKYVELDNVYSDSCHVR